MKTTIKLGVIAVFNPNLRNRSLLTLKHHTPTEIDTLLKLSADLKQKKKMGIRGKLLEQKNIALIFEKPSTRTRCAFSVACVDEGGHPEYLSSNDIQLGHKEDIKDTARVLGRMYHGIEFRGFDHKKVEALAQYAGVPVWNGLTDDYHPTQVLADFLTLKEQLGRLKGVRFVYVGDGRNNMANSLMIGAAKMGLHYVLAAPKSLFPDPDLVKECQQIARDSQNGATLEFLENAKDAVKGADVIYTDVWASMGEESKLAERKALLQPYQVNAALMAATEKADTIFLHCLPAVKGYEVTEDVFESNQSCVFDQAENRLHTIKAVVVSSIGNL